MSQRLFYLVLSYFFSGVYIHLNAQTNQTTSIFRIYEDNDFINIRGKGTDKAYSGGTRLDLFYEQKTKPQLFPGMLLSKNDSAVFTGSWGIMQMVFTPNNIKDPYFEPDDYFYSGALFIIHSLTSYSPARRYSFQAELQLGVRGPAALAKQTQTFVHRIIHYTIPMGWDNQLQNAPIINMNFGLEKQVTKSNKYFELLAGGKVYLGTMRNGLTFSPKFRWGLMTPYFNGYNSQFTRSKGKTNKIQAYIIITPEIQLNFSNALLESGAFAKTSPVKFNTQQSLIPSMTNSCLDPRIRRWVYAVNYGAVLSSGKLAISFVQNASTEMRKGTYSHEVGNISLFFLL